MIFHSGKIVFFHPGKTGGTSIEVALAKKYLNKEFSQLNARAADYNIMYGFCKKNKIYLHHADVRFYEINNIHIPQDYNCIVSVRRPYEKILSAYYYNSWDKKLNFKNFVSNKLEKLYNQNTKYAINHFCSQIHYLNSNSIIIQLENIYQDCETIDINLPQRKYAQTKANSIYKNYLDAYDTNMKDIVYNLYKEDFQNFSYNK